MNASQIQRTPSGGRKTTPLFDVADVFRPRRRQATSPPSPPTDRVGFMRPLRTRDASTESRSTARSRVGIGREKRHMETNTPKTIFITGATGLVGGHAVEEALRRGHRVRALVRATSDTRWLDEWGVEKVPGDLEDTDRAASAASPGRTGSSTARRRSATGGPSRSSAGSTSRPSASCSTPPRDARVERFVHVSSLGVYEGRDHHGTDETRAPRGRLARRLHPLQDRGRGPGAGLFTRSAASRRPSSGPASSTASATARSCPSCSRPCGEGGSPTSAPASRPSTASTSRTWSTASSSPPRARPRSARSST